MQGDIEVYGVSEHVAIGKDIVGLITAIMIKEGGRVRYEVTWWAGKIRHCEWFENCEVQPDKTRTHKIGFIQPKAKE